jgi:RNA polymerase sigma-54 factor
MKLETTLQPRMDQRLQLRLAPQIIQSIEILQLPILALQERIEQELEANPTLELEAPGDEEKVDEQAETDIERLTDDLDEWRDYYRQTESRPSRDEDKDEKLEALQNTSDKPITLQEHLNNQLRFLTVPENLRDIAQNIIYNLDRSGYLQYPLEEIVRSMEPVRSVEEGKAALEIVQGLEPRGVGARDLSECLLLQLDPRDANIELKRSLITAHLKDIEQNKLPKVAKECGVSVETVKQMISEIAVLNPRPGALFSDEVVPYVVPDVIVEENGDKYEVTLQEHYLPNLYISPEYRRMLRDARNGTETRDWIRRRIESASWLIKSIEQRRNTLYRVASKIVEFQKGFLDHGITRLRPLKMQEVADAVNMHVSTVSRAISGKYMQTPRGIYDMKFFFTGGLNTATGQEQSWDAVKQNLLDMIEKEDKQSPLSDEEIEEKFIEAGIPIARRTITKYRKILRIPSSRQRRQY